MDAAPLVPVGREGDIQGPRAKVGAADADIDHLGKGFALPVGNGAGIEIEQEIFSNLASSRSAAAVASG